MSGSPSSGWDGRAPSAQRPTADGPRWRLRAVRLGEENDRRVWGAPPADLGIAAAVARRKLLLTILLALAALAPAAVLVMRQTAVRIMVQLDAEDASGAPLEGPALERAGAALVERSVVNAAAGRLGTSAPPAANLTVDAAPGVLTLSTVSDEPEVTARLLNALAQDFLDRAQTGARPQASAADAAAAALKALETMLDGQRGTLRSLDRRIAQLEALLADAPDAAPHSRDPVVGEIAGLRERRAAVQAVVVDLERRRELGPDAAAEVVAASVAEQQARADARAVPRFRLSRRARSVVDATRWWMAAGWLLFGSVLALAATIGYDRLRRPVGSVEEVLAAAGTAVLTLGEEGR